MSELKRNNHYVPEWYQHGFLARDQYELHYHDMSPGQLVLPNGRVVPRKSDRKLGPKHCFRHYDLYSTFLGPLVNDDIERFLFGSIDDSGSRAIRAFARGDVSGMHKSFEEFFEYLDAQKLRTPKGLDWIKSRYSSLDQLQLMREMQGLRLMHCTMWAEGVREIVSAEESEIKFIVSDHPVTAYNAAVAPTAPGCAYPEDPALEWLGTQTVFALDANTCLVLTHLEYAQNSKAANLTAPRTHARYRGQSLVRTDAFIRKRKLSQDEVTAINHLLKSRARRYLAASNKDWLHPEKSFTGTWRDIAHVLLPKDELWRFGGEIYVGYKDGSTRYQDPFGRTSSAHEYLRKRRRSDLGPNHYCGCGSGRKFKRCCKNVPEDERPTWDVYGIRERNLMFCRRVQDILGLDAGKTWDHVRCELSDDNVRDIHKAFGSLWPEDTDLSELLPRPRDDTFRALYLGTSDPRTVVATVLGWLPYFEQVIVAHPFINPLRIKPEYSPTESPFQHRAQTLKNVALLLTLEPFIEAGDVHLIPDPGDFNALFGDAALRMAEQRAAGWKPDMDSAGLLTALAKDDFIRSMQQLPESVLKRMMQEAMPEAADATLDAALAYMKSELEADPLALLQPSKPGEKFAQLMYFKGYNLESAIYLASLTGSIIYTDLEAHWQQLQIHAQQTSSAPRAEWSPVVSALRSVAFPVETHLPSLLDALQAGRFGQIKLAFRLIAESLRPSSGAVQASHLALQIAKAAQAMEGEWAKVPQGQRLAGHVELSIPSGGFERTDVRRLLLTFGRAKSVRPIPFAMLIKLDGTAAADE